MPLALQVFANVIQTEFLFFYFGFFLVTFPGGHFVPRWSWLIGCTLFVQAIFFLIPGPFNILSWPLPLILIELALAWGSPVAIQIYRYRRVSTPAQRQQTRWVIFGLTCYILRGCAPGSSEHREEGSEENLLRMLRSSQAQLAPTRANVVSCADQSIFMYHQPQKPQPQFLHIPLESYQQLP